MQVIRMYHTLLGADGFRKVLSVLALLVRSYQILTQLLTIYKRGWTFTLSAMTAKLSRATASAPLWQAIAGEKKIRALIEPQ
jgi:hypothetical protein